MVNGLKTMAPGQSCWAHCYGEGVWTSCGESRPVGAVFHRLEEAALEAVCSGASLRRPRTVRVLGSALNTRLIVRLLAQPGVRVLLGSPRVLRRITRQEESLPERVLWASSDLNRAASVGGWRLADSGDLAAYNLCAACAGPGGPASEAARRWLARHPARRALEFLRPLDRPAAVEVLGSLRDPRWYIDPDRPDSWESLFQAYKLRGKEMQRLVSGRPAARVERWARLTARAWRGDGDIGDDPCPRAFLHELYWASSSPVEGLVRASRVFLELLCQVWLDAVNRRELFVPEHFFGRDGIARPDVAAAWREFSCRQGEAA